MKKKQSKKQILTATIDNVDINETGSNQNRTPFYHAVFCGHASVVEYLLSKGATDPGKIMRNCDEEEEKVNANQMEVRSLQRTSKLERFYKRMVKKEKNLNYKLLICFIKDFKRVERKNGSKKERK